MAEKNWWDKLKLVSKEMAGKMEVIMVEYVFGGYVFHISAMRPYGTTYPYLPSKVNLDGKPLWMFDQEKVKGAFRAYMLEIGGELIIGVEAGFKIIKVIAISDLPKLRSVKVAGEERLIGGRDMAEMLRLKNQVSQKLGKDIWLSREEREYRRKMLSAKEVIDYQKAEERRERRDQRRKDIMSRGQINGYFSDGRPVTGVPILDDEEWQCLQAGTKCIMVGGLQDNGKPVGEKGTAFIVKKKGGPALKEKEAEVLLSVPETVKDTQIEAIDEAMFIVDGSPSPQALLVFDQTGFDQLKKTGLNSGTMVAVQTENGVEVRQINGNKVKTLSARAV